MTRPQPDQVPVDWCLQCGDTRIEVKESQAICGTLDCDGELDHEFPGGRHRWADWPDRQLAFLRPEFRDAYRRAYVFALDGAPCAYRVEEHTFQAQWWSGDQTEACVRCGVAREGVEQSARIESTEGVTS